MREQWLEIIVLCISAKTLVTCKAVKKEKRKKEKKKEKKFSNVLLIDLVSSYLKVTDGKV